MTTPELATRLLQELTAALIDERDRLRRSIRTLATAECALAESQAAESGAGGDLADVASDLVEQDVDVTLERMEQERLAEVEDALARIATGRYGHCEACQLAVGVDRLYAQPWARRCLRCAERLGGRGGRPVAAKGS